MRHWTVFVAALLFALCWVTTAKAGDIEMRSYTRYKASVIEKDEHGILVKAQRMGDRGEDPEMELRLFTKGDVLDLETGRFVSNYAFEKGEQIVFFLRNNTPMLMSFPGQTTPQVIAVHPQTKYSVDVDYYTDKQEGIAKRLVIQSLEKTEVIDAKGNPVSVEMRKTVFPNELVVLYTVSTRSLPPQTAPEKVFVLAGSDQEPKVPEDKASLTAYVQGLVTRKDGQDVVALRAALEGKKVLVSYHSEKKQVEIAKFKAEGTLDFAKRIFHLGANTVEPSVLIVDRGVTYIDPETAVQVLMYFIGQ